MRLNEIMAQTVIAIENPATTSELEDTLNAYEVSELDSYDLHRILPTVFLRERQHDELEPVTG